MKDYYFTFGQDHVNNEGMLLRDFWVRVTADSYGKAREIFIEKFTTQELPRPMQWAFQYEGLENFKPDYFTNGELAHLTQIK